MLEIVVPIDTLVATDTADLCLDLIGQQQGAPAIQIRLHHSPLKVEALRRQLKPRKSFNIDVDGFNVHFATVGNYELSFITAQGVERQMESAWVEAIASRAPLISARAYDREYEYWQNAEDPLQYRTAGRSMEGLPMKSNGFPPPVEQMIVDTTHNPGRRILRKGYVEAIGHRMWLGSEFFSRVPGTKRDILLGEAWLRPSEKDNNVLELRPLDAPFVDGSTAETQTRLRRFLFPNNV